MFWSDQLPHVTSPQLSPLGGWVVYVQEKMVSDQVLEQQILLCKVGEPSKTMVYQGHHPVFSPDGQQIAFLSHRTGRLAIYLLPLHGGEARALDIPLYHFSQLSWSNDGRFLGFLAQEQAHPSPLSCQNEAFAEHEEVHTGSFGAQLYSYDLAQHSWRPRRQGSGVVQEYLWLPQQQGWLAVVSSSSASQPYTHQLIWIQKNGRIRTLLTWPHKLYGLSLHPEGQQVAFVGRSAHHQPDQVYMLSLQAPDQVQPLQPKHWHHPVGCTVSSDVDSFNDQQSQTSPIHWLDREHLAVLYTINGACGIFQLNIQQPNSTPQPLIFNPQRNIHMFHNIGRELIFIEDSPREWPELYHWRQGITPISYTAMPPSEHPLPIPLPPEASPDDALQLWLHLPRTSEHGIGAPLPCIVCIAELQYGYAYHAHAQALLTAGYALVYVDMPRNWPNRLSERARLQQQLEDQLDQLIRTYPLDPQRLGLLGEGTGAFWALWLSSGRHHFRAMICENGLANLVSWCGHHPVAHTIIYQQLQSANLETLWTASPLRDVQQVRTPTLWLHTKEQLGERSEQGQQWHRALRLQHIPSRLLTLTQPYSQTVCSESLGWFLQYL